MFKKILIANRGEIAVRIARTCREMGIETVALYEEDDQTSLHIRVADECARLSSPQGFNDQDAVLAIARARGADAVHPGYGFLAENVEFMRACAAAGLSFIGPPVDVLERVSAKIETIQAVRAAGFRTVENIGPCGAGEDLDGAQAAALKMGYPVVVKSCRGGRGRGERMVRGPEELTEAVRRAQAEAQAFYGERSVFLEKAITPAHQLGVQILAGADGRIVHLGEREGSLLHGNQKVLEESPAPCLDEAGRAQLWADALALARLLQLRGLLTVEFLVDERGRAYFTEIKPRIATDHGLTEQRTRLDLVRAQIQLAAGEPLELGQEDVRLEGWAMACRIYAQDPQQNFMASPGRVRVRFPNGPETRMDTYVYSGCVVPQAYDSLIAKLMVWGPDRASAHARLERALSELSFKGIATNVPLLQQLVQHPTLAAGTYTTETLGLIRAEPGAAPLRELAVAAALFYARANDMTRAVTPDRLASNWHRAARVLPD